MKLPEGLTRRKWEPKIKKERIFVGLQGNKLWKLLDPETLKEEASVDVEFHEFKFPSVAKRAEKAKGVVKVPIPTSVETLPASPRLPERSADVSQAGLPITVQEGPFQPGKRDCTACTDTGRLPAQGVSAGRSEAVEVEALIVR
jgi:hypothetical protein